MQSGTATLENILEVLQNVKQRNRMTQQFHSKVHKNPREMKTSTEKVGHECFYTAALFLIAISLFIDKILCIHTVDYYSAINIMKYLKILC